MPRAWLRRTGFKRRARSSLPSTAVKRRYVSGRRRRFGKKFKRRFNALGQKQKKVFKTKMFQSADSMMYLSPGDSLITKRTKATSVLFGTTQAQNRPKVSLFIALEAFQDFIKDKPDYGDTCFIKSITMRVMVTNHLIANEVNMTHGNCYVHKMIHRHKGMALYSIYLSDVLQTVQATVENAVRTTKNPQGVNYDYTKINIAKVKWGRFRIGETTTQIILPSEKFFKWKIKVNKSIPTNSFARMAAMFRDRAIYLSYEVGALSGQNGHALTVATYDVVYAENS